MRGESENRNKELKTELQADRLSDHRFLANFFRLYLHAAALNLLVRLRQAVVGTPPTSAELGLPAELPREAIDEPHRKRFFNRRCQRDPLGGGFASTWRTRLIKVAAEVIVAGSPSDRAALGELAAHRPLRTGQPSREWPARGSLAAVNPLRDCEPIDTNNVGMTTRGGGDCAGEDESASGPFFGRIKVVRIPGDTQIGYGVNNPG